MRGWALAFAAAFLACSPARALTVSEVQDRIKAEDANLKTVEFEYVQEMRSSQSPEVVKTRGKAFFSKPQNLRIEQSRPDEQIIVTSGRHVFIYTPKFKQVLKDSWKSWAKKNSFFPGLFGSSGTLDRLRKDFNWQVKETEKLSGEDTVKLRLEKRDSQGEVLHLWLGARDFIPRKAEIKSEGSSLTTSLLSLKINSGLDSKLFQFSPPKDSILVEVP